MRRGATTWLLTVAVALAAASCSSTAASTMTTTVSTSVAQSTGAPTTVTPTTVTPTTVTLTTVTLTTVTPTTATPATVTPTTVTPTTVTPTTVTPTTVTAMPDFLGEETIGTSVQGRPIVASHRGTAGGTVILVVGVIHGDEHAGLAILDDLRTMPLPPGIDLWLLPALNPDGLANNVRGNGHQVDLNRNFPHDWTAIASPGEWEYSGTGPASEPETKAFITFATRIKPRLTLWYHQNKFRISPSQRSDGPLRKRYAQLTGLPYKAVTGGTYTGVAATWVRLRVPNAMSFIVELGATLSPADAKVHAAAVLAISLMA